MIHWRCESGKCRSACADGNAICTTVASRTTISCATETKTRISQRWSLAEACARLRSATGLFDKAISCWGRSQAGPDRIEQRDEFGARGGVEHPENLFHCGC